MVFIYRPSVRWAKKSPLLAAAGDGQQTFSIGGDMNSIQQSSSEVKQYSAICTNQPAHARCPGCYNWTPVASLIKYPAGSIADWRDYYLCQSCDHTILTGCYGDYNHILDNIRDYDGGAA